MAITKILTIRITKARLIKPITNYNIAILIVVIIKVIIENYNIYNNSNNNDNNCNK